MAELPGELELYNQWFQLADLDRDGSISGADAVAFFQRSGLPQNPTLFKVRSSRPRSPAAGWATELSIAEPSPAIEPLAPALRRSGSMSPATARRSTDRSSTRP